MAAEQGADFLEARGGQLEIFEMLRRRRVGDAVLFGRFGHAELGQREMFAQMSHGFPPRTVHIMSVTD